MVIRKLKATFGKLDNVELTPDSGLNVLTLPNEAGKSTWCAFILAMLYGVDTARKDKAEELAEKNKYRPWSGKPMSGSMDVEWKGRLLHLERGGQGEAMKGFRAVYTDTGDPVEGMTGENAGELLTGMSRSLYERCGFIRQSAVSVDNIPQLESRLQLLVSDRENADTLPDAQEKLSQWQRRLKLNSKSGLIPELTARLETVRSLEKHMESLAQARMSAAAQLEKAEQEIRFYSAELENHNKLAAARRNRQLIEARMELVKAEQALRKEQVPIADVEELSELSREADRVKSLYLKAEELTLEAQHLEEQLPAEVQTPPVFDGLDAARTLQKAAEDTKQKEKLEEKSTVHRGILLFILTVLAGTALCALGALTAAGMYAYAAGVFFIGAGLFYFIKGTKEKNTAARELTVLTERYGTTDFMLLAQNYAEALNRAAESAEAVRKAQAKKTAALESAKVREADLLNRASRLLGGRGTLEEVIPAAEQAIGKVKSHMELTVRYKAAQETVTRLAEGMKDDSGKYQLESVPMVTTTEEQAEQSMHRAMEQKERWICEVSNLEGQLAALGDADAIREEAESLRQSLNTAQNRWEAIQIAREALNQAAAVLRGRYAPGLSALAGELFSQLTGGRYSELQVDRKLLPAVTMNEDNLSRDRRSLSAGTADQMYLALRLALCTLLDSGENPPIVLDDALCNFDDTRMVYALELLKEMSHHRQVFVFSCQDRVCRVMNNE